MTREDVQTCLKIGAAAATILALLGGPLAFGAYTFDDGIKKATTRCVTDRLSDISELLVARENSYMRYINAKVNIASIRLGYDLRATRAKAEEPTQDSEDVLGHKRDTAWNNIPRITEQIALLVEQAKRCPNYKGLLE